MKNKILFFLIIVLSFFIYSKASASESCSPNGYTILTINGILIDKNGAIQNKDNLVHRLSSFYNNQPLYVDYLYNATHLAGMSDLVDVVAQGGFGEKEDFDLTNMLNDASQKVLTQKLLLVAHSQGNFYANNFYDKVSSQEGGVPNQSIGVYGVASPADHIAGSGKYLTSDTDKVINYYASSILKVLLPNVHIPLQIGDDINGHNFSDVYLKYQSDRIVSDIKSSLSKLQNNDEQDSQSSCISAPKLTAIHKIKGVLFAIADPTAVVVKTGLVATYNSGAYIANGAYNTGATIGISIHNVALAIGNGLSNATLAMGNVFSKLSANVVDTLPDSNSLTTILPDLSASVNVETPQEQPVEIATVNENSVPSQEEIKNPEIITTEVPVAAEEPRKTEVVVVPEVTLIANSPVVYSSGGGGGTNGSIAPVDPVNTTAVDNSIVSDIIPPVITFNGDLTQYITINSVYTDPGATALDTVDGVRDIVATGTVDTAVNGNYTITYSASDISGNIATAVRNIIVSSYVYIPKYSFGMGNGDGNNWQDWFFNGSNVYDWSDIYVNNYLREQFTIKDFPGGYSCRQCLQRGIFNHDPQKGFETNNVVMSELENNPQNNSNNTTYNVDLQWDSDGYSFTISYDGVIYAKGHKNIPNVNENTWVGWDSTLNDFQKFSLGRWMGAYSLMPSGLSGGMDLVLQPYPVYVNSNPVLNSQKEIKTFNFGNAFPSVLGNVDDNKHTVSLDIPFGSDITNLIPKITISNNATIFPSPDIAQNFTNPITYTITAENGSTQNYVVTVIVGPDPNPAPILTTDVISPVVTLNGNLNENVIVNSVYTDPGATALDNVDGVLPVTVTGAVDTAVIGSYSLNYSATDHTGNTAMVYRIVTVSAEPNPTPSPVGDITPPSITSYTLNGNSSDITVNPTALKPLSLVVNVSENVDWTSIKIEKEDNSKLYKYFYPGVDCDGKNTCTQDWDGILKGGLIENGTYKIKVKIKDLTGNLYDSYLSPYVINVDTSL